MLNAAVTVITAMVLVALTIGLAWFVSYGAITFYFSKLKEHETWAKENEIYK